MEQHVPKGRPSEPWLEVGFNLPGAQGANIPSCLVPSASPFPTQPCPTSFRGTLGSCESPLCASDSLSPGRCVHAQLWYQQRGSDAQTHRSGPLLSSSHLPGYSQVSLLGWLLAGVLTPSLPPAPNRFSFNLASPVNGILFPTKPGCQSCLLLLSWPLSSHVLPTLPLLPAAGPLAQATSPLRERLQ